MAAYRRDLEGVARRISADAEVGVLHPRAADQGGAEGILRLLGRRSRRRFGATGDSLWSSFFDFLVAEDLEEGNPMAVVGKPRRDAGAPRAIRDPDAACSAAGHRGPG
jgi:site-specific recombinase XerD